MTERERYLFIKAIEYNKLYNESRNTKFKSIRTLCKELSEVSEVDVTDDEIYIIELVVKLNITDKLEKANLELEISLREKEEEANKNLTKENASYYWH